MIRLLSRLPLSVLYVLSYLLYAVAYYIVGYRRKVVRDNLKLAFPSWSEKQIRVTEKKFYKNLSQVLIEILKSYTISEKALKKRVTFTNPELAMEYLDKGESILMLAAHQCNWEWVLLGGCIHLKHNFDAVYKQLSNERFNKLMYTLRSRFGGRPIEMQSTLVEMMKRKKDVKVFGLVADQSPKKNEIEYWVDFLGIKTPFYTGPAYLAKLTKYPVFFINMKRVSRGHYTLTFEKLAEPPYEKDMNWLIDRYAAAVEAQIISSPADWLWSHKRWKHSPQK